jgi:hypothetical protein
MDSGEGEATVVDEIVRDIAQDVREVVSILKKPQQGGTKLRRFLEFRDGQP